MKKGILVGLLAVLLAGVVAVSVFLLWNREISLAERYPAITRGTYQANIMYRPGEDDMIEAAVTDEEFREILGAARVKKHEKTALAPDVEFFVHLYDSENQVTYSIDIGKDHTIYIARMDDLVGSRTYWTERGGEVFEKLYACHLANGGRALPEE